VVGQSIASSTMPRSGHCRVAKPSALASSGEVDEKLTTLEDVAPHALPRSTKTDVPHPGTLIDKRIQNCALEAPSISKNMIHLKLELGKIRRLVDNKISDLQHGIIAELRSLESNVDAIHAAATNTTPSGPVVNNVPQSTHHASDVLDRDSWQHEAFQPPSSVIMSSPLAGLLIDTRQVLDGTTAGNLQAISSCDSATEGTNQTDDAHPYIAAESISSSFPWSANATKDGELVLTVATHDVDRYHMSSSGSPRPASPAETSGTGTANNSNDSCSQKVHQQSYSKVGDIHSSKFSTYTDVRMSQKQIMEYQKGAQAEAEIRRKRLAVNMQMVQHGVSPIVAMLRHSMAGDDGGISEEDECTPTSDKWTRLRREVDSFLSHWAFDASMGFVILCNALTIGIATSKSVNNMPPPTYVRVLEDCFLALFIVELVLRFTAYGLRVIRSHWVKFDCFLVLIGILSLIAESSLSGTDLAGKLVFIRFFRLIRLARALRLLVHFQTLWLLVQGLLSSAMPLFWTMILIMVFLYVFAVTGMEVITQDPNGSWGESYKKAALNFSTVGNAIMTLMQLLTLDSVGQIYRPIINAKPYLSIYFMTFFLVASMALLNLVTALMVESASRQAREDREMRRAMQQCMKAALIPQLKDMFVQMDADKSGELQLSELLDADHTVHDYLQRFLDVENIKDLFMLLDYDGSGSVAIDEFCEGIMQAQSEKPMELLRVMKQTQEILTNSRTVMKVLATVTGVSEARLHTSLRNLSKEPRTTISGRIGRKFETAMLE